MTSILTLLSLLFVLPLNLTSSCTSNSQDPTACPQTDYDATTVANLPSRDTELDGGGWAELHVRPFLYCGVVYVTLIIVCRLLWMEWTACLKLRRKWYLEEDHYGRGRGRERDTENMGECEEQVRGEWRGEGGEKAQETTVNAPFRPRLTKPHPQTVPSASLPA